MSLHELSLQNSAMTVLSALYVKKHLYFVFCPTISCQQELLIEMLRDSITTLIQEPLLLYSTLICFSPRIFKKISITLIRIKQNQRGKN